MQCVTGVVCCKAGRAEEEEYAVQKGNREGLLHEHSPFNGIDINRVPYDMHHVPWMHAD